MKNLSQTPLLQHEVNALQEATEHLKKNYPIEHIILFGSKSRGSSDQYSDIDLLVISLRPLDWMEEKKIVENLFDVGQKHDVIFSPLFTTRSEWEDETFRQFPIYNEITADGAMVA
ncbi:MAG: nucleotidyltransferase domain-containing protein [Proteobacteria bacterium]|nr:nucleotidyltransferase domain-containing protein [Pseudomonadota bacterium]